MPSWFLVTAVGFFRFVQIGLYGAIVFKAGPPYLKALNETTSFAALGGWRGLGIGLLLGVLLCACAFVAWYAGKVAKLLDEEVDRRWSFKL
jgi:hypothetical protein